MGEDSEMTKTPSPPPPLHYVFVHGINGGAWCWYKIRCLLENSGGKVSCIDLKSAGIDRSDPDSIFSFEDYNKPLTDFMLALPDNEKVILVGHSAGGLSLTHASHNFAKKISLAIYVGATMLPLGFSTEQDAKDGVPDLSEFGDVYELGFGSGLDQAPTSCIVKKGFQRKIIYHMCSQEDSILASMLLKPGPLQALLNARFIEGEGVEQVPRVYIKTMHDRVLKPEQQDAMIKRWPPLDVFSVESDHSPFFSASSSLVILLIKAVASTGQPISIQGLT